MEEVEEYRASAVRRFLPLVLPHVKACHDMWIMLSLNIKSKGIPCTMSSPQLDIHLVVEKDRMLRLTIVVIATARPSSPSRRTISVIAAALRGLPQGNHRKRTPSQGNAETRNSTSGRMEAQASRRAEGSQASRRADNKQASRRAMNKSKPCGEP